MRKKSKLVIVLLVVAFCMCALSACVLGGEKTVTVTFFSDGGSDVAPVTVTKGEAVQKPADPTKEHYTFLGWLTNANIAVPFPYTPDLDTTLYAKWERAEYTIKFELNGGTYSGSEAVLNQTVSSGDNATLPDNPRKIGFGFLGWDPEPNLTDIRANATYTAQWGEAVQRLEFSKISGVDEYEVRIMSTNEATGIVIPNTYSDLPVTRIAAGAFSGWEMLTSITIPSSITSIGDGAFSRCKGLTSITIPSSVKVIPYTAFFQCSGLTSVTLSSGLESIERSALNSCTKLEQITIPSSVTSIGESAFEGCTKLDEVTIGDTTTASVLETIAKNAFKGCTSLSEIVIPSSVTTIGLSAFEGCTSLERITIPFAGQSASQESNTHFGYIFGASSIDFNYSKVPQSLTVVVVGGTSIADKAFSKCAYITGLTIADTVESIGDNAFEQCSSLRLVTIGSGVERIGKNAFQHCFALDRVTFEQKQGWYLSANGINVYESVSVQNDDNNATNLKTTYVDYYWLMGL